MATIEIGAPTGYTLTAKLGPIGTNTVSLSGVALAERSNVKGRYTCTVTGLTGWHWIQAFSGQMLVAHWDVEIIAETGTYLGQDRDNSLWARRTAPAPVITIPDPPDAAHTVAWVRCISATGAVESGVTVKLAAVRITDDDAVGSGWSHAIQEATSDIDGMVSFLIPRTTALQYRVWRENGAARVFPSADVETITLPDLLG